MNKIVLMSVVLLAILSGCGDIGQKTKETLNEGGEMVGKAASEFAEGVSEGVDRTLECELVLSDDLKSLGLSTGTYYIAADSAGNADNTAVIYFIFNQAVDREVMVKAFHKDGLEVGRRQIHLTGNPGEAKYVEVTFDPRTRIEKRSRITFE